MHPKASWAGLICCAHQHYHSQFILSCRAQKRKAYHYFFTIIKLSVSRKKSKLHIVTYCVGSEVN